MRRLRALGLAALLLLPASAFAENAEKKPPEAETWYARRLTLGDTPLRVEHFWSKGRRMRAHTVVAGHPLITIVNGDRYYVLDALTGKGIGIRRSPRALRADEKGGRPFGNEAKRLLDKGAEKVKTERLAGALCDVYRITDSRGRREVWITQEAPHVPLRIEVFDRSSGRTGRNDYLDWSQSLEIPDAFFEPDPRFEMELVEYEDYLTRSADGPVGPAPVLYSDLLHGK